MEPDETTLIFRTIVEEVIAGKDDEGVPNVKYKFKHLPAYLHVLGYPELSINDWVRITISKTPAPTITKEPKPDAQQDAGRPGSGKSRLVKAISDFIQ